MRPALRSRFGEARVSKKLVERALDLTAAGALEEAMAALEPVSDQFVRKRLRLVMGRSGPRAGVARRLWAARYEEDAPPTPTPPVPPAEHAAPPAPAKPTVRLAAKLTMEKPLLFLQAVTGREPRTLDPSATRLAHIWALVGAAALCRRDRADAWALNVQRFPRDAARFAHAVGWRDAVEGRAPSRPAEPNRTVPLQRVRSLREIEASSRRIAQLMVPGDEDVELTLRYVLIELLRNVVQHSQDPLGGVVAAQVQRDPEHYPRPMVQVAVADAGIGFLEALRPNHPALTDPRAAITNALRPHVSGTFGEGRRGGTYNAGLGLFFISEMAKLTAGRLVIATRGAARTLEGDEAGHDRHQGLWVGPEGTGYPGTLVGFELPLEDALDYEAMLETIRHRAEERQVGDAGRAVRGPLRWARAPEGVPPLLVHRLAEDVTQASRVAREELQPRILRREPVALDFRGLELGTQSFLHALLFETLRLAWALDVPVYAMNVDPAVRSGLDLVAGYALAR